MSTLELSGLLADTNRPDSGVPAFAGRIVTVGVSRRRSGAQPRAGTNCAEVFRTVGVPPLRSAVSRVLFVACEVVGSYKTQIRKASSIFRPSDA